jgi:hypothetical protein
MTEVSWILFFLGMLALALSLMSHMHIQEARTNPLRLPMLVEYKVERFAYAIFFFLFMAVVILRY